jgi:hypothetical protein
MVAVEPAVPAVRAVPASVARAVARRVLVSAVPAAWAPAVPALQVVSVAMAWDSAVLVDPAVPVGLVEPAVPAEPVPSVEPAVPVAAPRSASAGR